MYISTTDDDALRAMERAADRVNTEFDESESGDSGFFPWTTQDRWMIAYVFIFTAIGVVAAVAGIVMVIEGRQKCNSVKNDVNSTRSNIDEASQFLSECYSCIEGAQPGANIPFTPDHTFLIKAKMAISKHASQFTHFPGGIDMPGISFGQQVSGYNDPVIIGRGALFNVTDGPSNLFGNPGLTSISAVSSSASITNTVNKRCQILYYESAADQQLLVSKVPVYVLYDTSVMQFKVCMCTCYIEDPVPADCSDSEWCVALDGASVP